MTAFLLGVLSSLAATMVVCGIGWLRSTRPRRWLIALLSRCTGLGIRRVYPQQRSAEVDMRRDIAEARWVKVVTGRGNTLTRDAFSSLWSGEQPSTSVRVLLPNPDAGPTSWLKRREHDLRQFDHGFTDGTLAEQVRTNVGYLSRVARQRTGVEVRSCDLPQVGRVIATDQAAYVTFYTRFSHGRDAPCLYVRAPGLLYDAALRIFESAWSAASPLGESTE